MEASTIAVFGVLFLAALYLGYVNRPLQRYRGAFFIAATPVEVADSLVPIPGQPYLHEKLVVEAVGGSSDDMRLIMPNGSETRVRILEDARPHHVVFEGVTRRSPASLWGDRIFSREAVKAAPGGAVIDYDIRIERGPLGQALVQRLVYPFQGRLYKWMTDTEIARRRQAHGKGPWGS